MFLRHATNSQEVLLGRFLDPADGDSQVTGLTIANTDIKLFKHGAAAQVNKDSGGATHDAGAMYVATFNATDTDTLGNLEANVHVAGALPVKREFVVLPAAIYDCFIGGGVIPDSTPALGTRPTPLEALLLLARGFLDRDFVAAVATVYKEDGTTPAYEVTADDASAPTEYHRTA
jgi:hypothetical protein